MCPRNIFCLWKVTYFTVLTFKFSYLISCGFFSVHFFSVTCQFVPDFFCDVSTCPKNTLLHNIAFKTLTSLLVIPSGSEKSLHPLISSRSGSAILHIDLFIYTSFFKSLSLQFRVVPDGPYVHSSFSTFNYRMSSVVPVMPEHLKLAHSKISLLISMFPRVCSHS